MVKMDEMKLFTGCVQEVYNGLNYMGFEVEEKMTTQKGDGGEVCKAPYDPMSD
jgi:hypothetical protein